MSEFFKSAMGYFNTAPNANVIGDTVNSNSGSGTPVANITTNEFCGQIVEVAGHKLRVKGVNGEGKYCILP